MKNLLLIGAGGIGFRHFQALSKINCEVAIQVADPSLAAHKRIKDYIKELDNKKIANIELLTDLHSINKNIDVAIIATNADIRRNVIAELCSKAKVDFLILEKVLFQNADDYFEIDKLLLEKEIKAYVNCGRRTFDVYKKIKKLCDGSRRINLSYRDQSWGLTCNSIHFIDLLAYLSMTQPSEKIKMDAKIYKVMESKRRGFIEAIGSIEGNLGENTFYLESTEDAVDNAVIEIYSDNNVRCIVDEQQGQAYISGKAIEADEFSFKIPYQSEMTNVIVEEIFKSNVCSLIPYLESMHLHVPMIKAFSKAMNMEAEGSCACKIT